MPETLLQKSSGFSTGTHQYNNSVLFEPPKKIQKSFYECGKHFVLNSILEMYKKETCLGVVFITGKEYLIYKIIKTGNHYEYKKILSKEVMPIKRHKKGGSSSDRYARNTDRLEQAYIKTVGTVVAKAFMEKNNTECLVEKLVIAGPGNIKNLLCQDPLVKKYYQNIIITKNIGDINDKSIFEIMDETKTIFVENREEYENGVLDNVKELMMQASDKLLYGSIEVLKALETNELEKIITDKETAKLFSNEGKCEIIIIESHKLEMIGINVFGLRFY